MARRAERNEPATRVLPPDALLALLRGLTGIGGATWIRVTGISMNPLLRDGDSVLIGPITKKLRPGRIVFMDVEGSPILHRVRRRVGTSIVARGDASRHDDGPVGVDNCVGLAIAVRRDGVLIALIPTLRFGLSPFIRYVAWWLRVRFPGPSGSVTRPLFRAIGRALT